MSLRMSFKKSKLFFHKTKSVESSNIVKPEKTVKKLNRMDDHQNSFEKRPSLSVSLSNSIRELNHIHDEVHEAESTLGMLFIFISHITVWAKNRKIVQ